MTKSFLVALALNATANEMVDALETAFLGPPQAMRDDGNDFLNEVLERSIFQLPGSPIMGDPACRGIAAVATIDICKSARELLRSKVAGASWPASGGRGKRGFGCPDCVKKRLPVRFARFERQPATWIVVFDDGLGCRVGLVEERDDIAGMVDDMVKPSIDLCARAGAIHVAQQTPAAAQLAGNLLDRKIDPINKGTTCRRRFPPLHEASFTRHIRVIRNIYRVIAPFLFIEIDREEFGDTVAALSESPIDRMTDYGRPSVASPALSWILPLSHRNAQRSWPNSS